MYGNLHKQKQLKPICLGNYFVNLTTWFNWLVIMGFIKQTMETILQRTTHIYFQIHCR